MNEIVQFKQVEEKILNIRNQYVLLDSDVASLYGVETREINQAIKNNPDKFPEGYVVQLSKEEWTNLKSKFLISSWGGKNKLPNVFSEKGLYMLATILKSPKATQTTIAIVETFTKIRELSRTVSQLAETREEPKQKNLMQKSGEIIADILGDDLQVTGTETSFEINDKNNYGSTALMYACSVLNIDVVRLLLANGADADSECFLDVFGQWDMSEDEIQIQIELSKLLLDKNIDVNIKDNGKTALMLIVQRADYDDSKLLLEKRIELLRLILDSGADINAKDNDEKNCLDVSNRIQQ